MEFRTIVITVNGSRLDSYFTIRQTTGDTIRINNENTTGPNTYPVLNDNYQTLFPGQTENFRFIGIINQNKVVDEMFKIRADDCHINYVSGNQQVTP